MEHDLFMDAIQDVSAENWLDNVRQQYGEGLSDDLIAQSVQIGRAHV